MGHSEGSHDSGKDIHGVMCAQDQDRSHLEQGKQDRCGYQPIPAHAG